MRQIALTETDLAALAKGKEALKRLDSAIRTLCQHRCTDELIETMRESWQDLARLTVVAETYMSNQRRRPQEQDKEQES